MKNILRLIVLAALLVSSNLASSSVARFDGDPLPTCEPGKPCLPK
jgi:hypothetical protein